MGRLKTIGLALAALAGVGAAALGGFAWWASGLTHEMLHTTYETHRVEFPIPFPLGEAEIAALRAEKEAELAAAAPGGEAPGKTAAEAPPAGAGAPEAPPVDVLAGVDLDAIALERARARGEHLVKGRYVCVACHGADFGGGTMVDDPMIGAFYGPNVTSGGRTANYTASDWDRAVRHGVNAAGFGTAMPVWDFIRMTDRELSDIVTYIRALPPSHAADRQERPTLGPLGTVLVVTGALKTDVSRIADHHAEHRVEPPEAAVTVEFGQHLAQVCSGCHRDNFEGGPIAAGPPDWPPAGNLTQHEQGVKGWSVADFKTALRAGKRPDGSVLKVPMVEIIPFAMEMTDTEIEAIWTYVQSLPPVPDGT